MILIFKFETMVFFNFIFFSIAAVADFNVYLQYLLRSVYLPDKLIFFK